MATHRFYRSQRLVGLAGSDFARIRALVKYRIAGFISGIFIPMRTPKRGFT
jgi:hypothetical protein